MPPTYRNEEEEESRRRTQRRRRRRKQKKKDKKKKKTTKKTSSDNNSNDTKGNSPLHMVRLQHYNSTQLHSRLQVNAINSPHTQNNNVNLKLLPADRPPGTHRARIPSVGRQSKGGKRSSVVFCFCFVCLFFYCFFTSNLRTGARILNLQSAGIRPNAVIAVTLFCCCCCCFSPAI